MGVWAIIARLAVAIVCSAAVGFERETAQKAAGLRTHSLVGVGSAIFSMLSIVGFEGPDESRVAAQIVTGIGFLGAGAIFREGQFVQGLTTAAGLWTVAAIGMAAGSGSYVIALLSTVAVLGVLYSLRGVDEFVARRTRRVKERIEVTLEEAAGLSQLLKFIRRLDEGADQMNFKRSADGGGTLEIAVDPDRVAMLCEMIAVHNGVRQVVQLSPLYWTHPKK
ncbi:MAG: MgtC/SapB family protein [Acidimicrobiia bacterium]|nr:MgtC/SapB family protein [Acidimicrobiia bacterium]